MFAASLHADGRASLPPLVHRVTRKRRQPCTASRPRADDQHGTQALLQLSCHAPRFRAGANVQICALSPWCALSRTPFRPSPSLHFSPALTAVHYRDIQLTSSSSHSRPAHDSGECAATVAVSRCGLGARGPQAGHSTRVDTRIQRLPHPMTSLRQRSGSLLRPLILAEHSHDLALTCLAQQHLLRGKTRRGLGEWWRLLGGTGPVQPGEPRAQVPRLGSSRQVTYPAALGGL